MNQYLKTIQDLLQQNNQLSEQDKQSILKTLTDADKQWNITEFKLDRTEKVKRTTAILLEETIEELEQKRKAVEEQNRELEIESALERVRTAAMAMKQPEDMVDICHIISDQLELLNVKEIRNIQTAIFYEGKGTYFNFEYYTFHKKPLVTEVEYINHPMTAEFAGQMLGGPGKFFNRSLKGKELKDWYEFQKTTNQFADEHLEVASSLNYYWFSLGPVALGISTYAPLNEEEINLFKRFIKVFELSYRRYLDIEKAEAQAREAQIEAALEKVRSRSLAMHKSDELEQVVTVVNEKLRELDVSMKDRSASMIIFEEGSKDLIQWVASHEHESSSYFRTPYFDHPIFNDLLEAKEKGADFFYKVYAPEVKNSYFRYFFEHSDYKLLPDSTKKWILENEHYALSIAYTKNSALAIVNLSGKPLSENENDILKRFSRVFEQSYTRFLDLQKAEAQARESQIQLALERVRARTMAMQHSNELAEAAALLFKQVKSLGVPAYSCGYNIWEKDEKEFTSWMSTQDGSDFNAVLHIPLTEDANFIRYDESRQKGEPFFVLELRGARMQEHYRYLNTIPAFKAWFDYAAAMGFDLPKTQTHHVANFSHGNLLFITLEPCPEFHDVFKRFAAVFDQTYTRFLDLQKAEAQAREAQIQLAMERVRARTMAMQKSDELGDVASLLFKQIGDLGIKAWSSGFQIWNADDISTTTWMSRPDGGFLAPLRLPHTEDPYFKNIYDARHNADRFFVMESGGKELEQTYKYMFSIPEWKKTFGDIEDSGFPIPTFQITHCVFFPQGYLMLITYESYPEAWDIFKRFGKVFEQTYTRFLDLQKAEAQAKESQIEAALERVRSRSMGMQKSDELKEVIQVVYEQFVHLNIQVEHTGFIMDYKERDDMHIWLADKHAVPFQVTIPYFDCAHWNSFNETKEKERDFFANHLSFEEKNRFYQDLFKLIPGVPEEALEYYFSCPGLAISTVLLENVGLYIENFSGIPYSDEENATLMRFGKVFQQTYTRFLDLQKAEAQTRESQIQLALERVRARTMAMQKSDELSETAYVLFQQFKELGELPIQITIGIINEKERSIEFRLTGWDGSGSQINRAFNAEIDEPTLMQKIFKAWKEKKNSIVIDLSGKELMGWVAYRNSISGNVDLNDYSDARRFVSVGFFSKGLISISTLEPLPKETVQLLERFAGVFDLTYTRFLDLKQAEAQTREAKIETALEKVRSRAMAMQNSEELNALVGTVFTELTKLDLILTRSVIMIYEPATYAARWWIANSEAPSQPMTFLVKHHDLPYFNAYLKGWQERNLKLTYELEGKAKIELDDFLFSETELSQLPGFVITGMRAPDKVYLNASFNNFGNLTLASLEPLSDEHFDILLRFAKVFDLTYTRFNDLKQAEAQAREAQIEASLERVRYRAMAMQSSEDVGSATAVVFNEISLLGVETMRCGITIIHPDKTAEVWAATTTNEGKEMKGAGSINFNDHPLWVGLFNAWQDKKENFSYHLKGNDLRAYYKALANSHNYSAPYLKDELPEHFFYASFFEEGAVFTFSLQPHHEENQKILKKFTAVFSLTFRRYQDLKKAEAQAREAKIEAALERTRTQSMLMQHSKELDDTLRVFHEQVLLLGIHSAFSFLWLPDETKDRHIFWATWAENPPGRQLVKNSSTVFKSKAINYPLDRNEPATAQCLVDWKSDEPIVSYHVPPAGVESYFAAWQELIAGVEQLKPEYFSDGLYYVEAFMKFGCFGVMIKNELPEEEKKILGRFAIEFEHAYTRFLDLQKAEAQAREAKIEAAMEKVRARAMAMQKPGELVEVAQLLRREMGLLGVEELETSSIYINDEVLGTTECWYAIQDIREQNRKLVTDHMTIHLNDTWVGREMLKFYTSDQKQTSILMQGENRKEWINYCAQHSKVFQGYYGDVIPERTYHLLKFSNGYMGAASPGDISAESWELLKRATAVFSLAYTRFRDLQLAEANAKEAIKQSSLDRIRADIASMRTIADLDKITPLIWNELTILGVPFIRCGVFIMDESQKLIHSFLSTPEGKAIAAFHIPYDSPGNIGQVLSHWQNKKNYIDHWDEKAFTEFANTLVKQGALNSPQQYLKTIPKGGFHLHFLPFLQGMLYVGNTSQLSEDEIKLIQSVADAFSTAYARYEDFNKLEAAKQQVEKTLVDLKQAQTQLVQSEKMASLGELTAGIAHEIQNPLNFVNNFSEVNKELIDEMQQEIDKGNYTDAKEISNDIKENEEKINHHGKRADAIVKGMLQHSRSNSGVKEPTDINALADEYLRLAYHGLRAKDNSFNAVTRTDFDEMVGNVNIIPQDIGRVILNLLTNAFYAVNEKKKTAGSGYEPTVLVSTKKINDKSASYRVEIRVKDNGNGIPQKVLDKIFQPFFTTKPTGQGTGLGLSLSYDIVKAHGGKIKVESKEGEGSDFIIVLPINT